MIKVACVGDSITRGFSIYRRGHYCYPSVLNRLLGQEYMVENFGVTSTTAMKSADFPYKTTKKYRMSLDFQPDVVLLMLGSNDTKTYNWNKETFNREYRELVNVYRNLESHPKVYIMIPPTVFTFNGKTLNHHSKTLIDNELVPGLKGLAADMGLETIDIFSALNKRDMFFIDRLHPNRKGARTIAEKVFSRLKI